MKSDKLLINTHVKRTRNQFYITLLFKRMRNRLYSRDTDKFISYCWTWNPTSQVIFLVCCRTDLNILTLAPLVAMMSIKLSSVLDRAIFFAMMVTNFTVSDPNDEKKCCSSIFIAFVFSKWYFKFTIGFSPDKCLLFWLDGFPGCHAICR